MRPIVFGCAGAALTADERAFFRDSDPWGFILFARNVADPAGLRALIADLRDAVGRNAPILIDQEGGRVARLKAPYWRRWAAPLSVAQNPHLCEDERLEALSLRYAWIAAELRALGADVNCAPLLDMSMPGANAVIGDRALGDAVDSVIRRGRAVYDALRAGGCTPVVKHIPGHGRADVDSHLSLPTVATDAETLRAVDFAPFKAFADAPAGMTAHIVYTAFDAERPATQSPVMIDLIRRDIGFDGLLFTDDLGMEALSGDHGERAAASLAAGCDVALHCDGDMANMRAVAERVERSSPQAARRIAAFEAQRAPTPPFFDWAAAEDRLAALAARACLAHV